MLYLISQPLPVASNLTQLAKLQEVIVIGLVGQTTSHQVTECFGGLYAKLTSCWYQCISQYAELSL